jgi:hypothetical protein
MIYWAEQFYHEESERLRMCLDCGDDLRIHEEGRCAYCDSLHVWEALYGREDLPSSDPDAPRPDGR